MRDSVSKKSLKDVVAEAIGDMRLDTVGVHDACSFLTRRLNEQTSAYIARRDRAFEAFMATWEDT